MSFPNSFTRIQVDAKHVVDWSQTIRLRSDVLCEIERIAGPSMDTRFLADGDQLDPLTETWGWGIDWDLARSGITGKRVISFWFRERSHAIYFKLLWGGCDPS